MIREGGKYRGLYTTLHRPASVDVLGVRTHTRETCRDPHFGGCVRPEIAKSDIRSHFGLRPIEFLRQCTTSNQEDLVEVHADEV
jgi:hypothetical protein